jgi:hypothetical protein
VDEDLEPGVLGPRVDNDSADVKSGAPDGLATHVDDGDLFGTLAE